MLNWLHRRIQEGRGTQAASLRAVLPDGFVHVLTGHHSAVTMCQQTRWTTGDLAAADAPVTCSTCLVRAISAEVGNVIVRARQ